MTKVLTLVLAGGNGTRLHPLTAEHAKPALPFAEGYRIVDFVLSNLVNSQLSPIYVLVQYKPDSLIEHLHTAWAPWCREADRRISVVSPRSDGAKTAFKGTADAVYQNLDLIARHQPDVVAVFAADHVYRMDVRQMLEFHRRCNAEVSVAALPVPLATASEFGVIATSDDNRIRDFQEKPARPAPIPADPHHAYASMGNYLFNPDVLTALLEDAHKRGDTDFGRHILPRASAKHRVLAYDFASNQVPGLKPHEEPGYWRDVGTLDAYRAAQRDAAGPRPRLSLFNPQWPLGADCDPPRRSGASAPSPREVRVPESSGVGADVRREIRPAGVPVLTPPL